MRLTATQARISVWLLYAVAFVPAAWAAWLTVNDAIGADPVRELEHRFGLWALRFLILALCITPARQILGVNLLRYRRALGLTAFWYALLHLTVWLVLDRELEAGAIVADIVKRPYITIGMAAFAILVPLALTSNRFSIRKLGGAAWAKLHKFAYLATALAALHFVMVVKSWPPEPLIYSAIVAALLIYRAVNAARQRRRSGRASTARAAVDPRSGERRGSQGAPIG